MPDNIEFQPLATSDPLDDDQPITTSTTPKKPNPHSPKHNSFAAQIERLGDMAISGLGPVLISLAFLLLSVTIGDAMFQDVLGEMETYTATPPICKRSCVYFVIVGAGPFMLAADASSDNNWPYWMDRSLVAFSEVLAVAIGVAVGGMGIWHWYLALTAQTTLEQYNNAYMKKICKKRGETFTNMYDFGIIGNFQDIFNIGPRGHYPWYTALLPIRIPPIGNGKRYERSGRGYVLDFGDDDEDMV
ncbi:hypothetical protein KI688_002569 [Linnemannia hyalina]|uniref:Uncharacterized protein n=1 Tax=Linnemannia hyalina TaxID=64524 RepID=A0A9P8BRQ9_9FUNG|nr:hypothetical protein KI688_002569 [Linnemannia hyalina]